MEFTVPNVEYAVSVFYNSDQNERVQAHQWLTAAQRCQEAWSFVWELLQSNKGTEVQFFAATTLHTKLLRCWHELPPESYEELRNKILQTILSYANGPKIVLNRLCISLAAFILQLGGTDLVATLSPLSSAENMAILLEVLTVIPEEFNSMTMGTQLRIKNRMSLQQSCPAVLNDMMRYLQTGLEKEAPSEETMQRWCVAAQCAASWLSLDGDEASVRQEGTASSLADRLPLCFALLNVVQIIYTHNEIISDTALEACEAALNAVRAGGASPDAVSQPAAAAPLLAAVAGLAHPIQARDNLPDSVNEELLSALATCCVSLCECHSRALVAAAQGPAPHDARLMLEVLLATQGSPGYYPLHETRSSLVFGWWYTLQDEILHLKEKTGEMDPYWPQLFSRLLNILIQKSEAPSEDVLSKDDAESLRCYRQDVADTVMYCYCILGEWSWSLVLSAWRGAGAAGQGGEGAAGRGGAAGRECRQEAALHVFLTLADAAPPHSNNEHLMTMLENAVNAATEATDLRLLNTALECLGAYASWLSSMSGRGRALAERALRAAGGALPRAAPAAALALKKLSAECGDLAAHLLEEIVMAVKSSAGGSDGWVRRQLVGAAGAALCCAGPHAAALLPALTHDICREMATQIETPSKRQSGAEAAAALLTALAPRPDLAKEMFTTLLPSLPPFALNHMLTPALFLILKQAVCVLQDDCLPFIEDVANLSMKACETHPSSSGLDVVKLIVLSFGGQWSGCGPLLHSCISACARAVAAAPSSRSDLTDAVFTTLCAITKKKPSYLDALEDIMPELVTLGCESIRLWEAHAAAAACRWVSALCASRPRALQSAAPALTAALCRCIGGATPRNQIEPLAELLLSLNKASWEEPEGGAGGVAHGLGAWLRAALAPPGFPTIHAQEQHKQKFISAVLKEKSSKRRLLESVQEFSLTCRGLVGTEYARQTLANNKY